MGGTSSSGGSSWPAAVAGSAASGMFSGFMQLMQRKTDKQNQIRQNAMNKQMSQLEFAQNLDMWNRANTYNSPAEQMRRYKEAGLNPNLIYGGGPGNMAVGTLPRYNAPQMDVSDPAPINVMQMLSTYQDTQMKQAQIDNLKAQRRVIESNAVLNDLKKYLTQYQIAPAWLKSEDAQAALKLVYNQGGEFQKYSPVVNAKVAAEYQKNAAALAKTNAEVALMNTKKDINEINLKYMNMGSPMWNYILRGAGLILRR